MWLVAWFAGLPGLPEPVLGHVTTMSAVNTASTSLINRVSKISAELELGQSENERQRSLSSETVKLLQSVDAFRLFVPKEYQGPVATVIEKIEALALISESDAAAGWCATVASQTSHMAGNLAADVARAVFGDPASIANGTFAPNGRALREDGGYRLSGRWAWGSGSGFAHWISAGAMTDSGEFLQMIVPASEVMIHDTWYSAGLAGTGSNDIEMVDVLVPDGRFVAFGRAKPLVSDTITRVPGFVLFAGGIAAVMVGIARRAVREALILSAVRTPAQSSKPVAQSSVSQVDIARADSLVRSATAWFFNEINDVVSTIERGDRASIEQRLRVRQASAFAAEQCTAAVDICFRLGGGTAVYQSSPLQRCFRDIHTAAAHIMVAPRMYETVGRSLLGLSIDTNSL